MNKGCQPKDQPAIKATRRLGEVCRVEAFSIRFTSGFTGASEAVAAFAPPSDSAPAWRSLPRVTRMLWQALLLLSMALDGAAALALDGQRVVVTGGGRGIGKVLGQAHCTKV